MPPGTAHMSAVRRSNKLAAAMQAPAVSIKTRHAASMMATGPAIFLKRARSLRSMEHPTKAPATICTAVRVPSGTQAPEAAQLSKATATNAPTIYPAGTRMRLNSSPHAMPTHSVIASLATMGRPSSISTPFTILGAV